MKHTKKYEYKVCGAFRFFILFLASLVFGAFLFFVVLSGDKLDAKELALTFLVALVWTFVAFLFFYNWSYVRVGINSEGIYVRNYGIVPWDSVESFSLAQTRETARGSHFLICVHRWLIINLKKESSISGVKQAVLVGPERNLSKKNQKIVKALQEYCRQYL